jgi:hypothetical protein
MTPHQGLNGLLRTQIAIQQSHYSLRNGHLDT